MILFQKLIKKEKGGSAVKAEHSGLLSELCACGLLDGLVEDYIEHCRETAPQDGSRTRSKARFPNIAGLCRYLNTGISDVDELKRSFPEDCARLYAIFEDEALNADVSPTVLSAYFKKRLAYSDTCTKAAGEEVSYCFEHDVFRDGE